MESPVELAPDYYLENFQALMQFVADRYMDLLSAEEQRFYDAFRAQGVDAQRLYVRLLSRKGVPSGAGALFRLGKLKYEEITDLSTAVDQLHADGLLRIDPEQGAGALLPLFTKPELVARAPVPQAKNLKRDALEQALLEHHDDRMLRTRLTRDETILAVQSAEHFDTFRLLFFGNLHQDLTDYVLRDLGLYRYERYPLDRNNLPFRSRDQLDLHRQYYRCLEDLDSALETGTDAILMLAEALPDSHPEDATLDRRLDRLRLTLARQLERLDALAEADQLYRHCGRPPARERRARIAVTRGDGDAGLALCRQILQQPANEAEQLFAESFGHRTAKKLGQQAHWPAPRRYTAPTETVRLAQTDERVELVAAEYLEGEASGSGDCFWVENMLFNGMLGLYLWDQVFAPVPGAFFNPFQIAPSDFRTSDFYPQRRAAIDAHLTALDRETLQERILQTYRDKQDIANPLVAWDGLSETLLEFAIERIPADHWRAIFQRLVSDIPQHRNGMPDLILFPEHCGYELVEVKGPGDRLQQNQQRWLRYFAEHQIPHRVLHVEWQP